MTREKPWQDRSCGGLSARLQHGVHTAHPRAGGGRPLREIWTTEPDLRPYTALVPSVSLDARNPGGGRGARESAQLDFDFEDVAEERAFNRVLWRAIKGDTVPYPGTNRMSALEWKRGW